MFFLLQGVILTYKAQGGDTVTMFVISSSQRENHFKAMRTYFLKMFIRAFLRAKYMF